MDAAEHTHNPENDAIGNAKASLQMKDFELKINFAQGKQIVLRPSGKRVQSHSA